MSPTLTILKHRAQNVTHQDPTGQEKGLVPTPLSLSVGTADLAMESKSQALLQQRTHQLFSHKGLGTKRTCSRHIGGHWAGLGRKGKVRGSLGEGPVGNSEVQELLCSCPEALGSWPRGTAGAEAASRAIQGLPGVTGMGMQQESWSQVFPGKTPGLRGVVWRVKGLHWPMLGQTGMAWSVVAMEGEGLIPAELMVPTSGVFRISTLSKSICRDQETSLATGMSPVPARDGGTKLSPDSQTGCPPISPLTHLPEIIFSSLQECLGEENKLWFWIGRWGCGATRVQGPKTGVGQVKVRQGGPKDTELE